MTVAKFIAAQQMDEISEIFEGNSFRRAQLAFGIVYACFPVSVNFLTIEEYVWARKVGSGLDVEAIVTALVDADVAPKNNSLDRREIRLAAELSAVGSLKSSLSALDTAIRD